MDWILFTLGLVFLAIGILGQIFGTRRVGIDNPGDRRALRWVTVVVSIVIGLWILIWSASHILHARATEQ